MKLIIAGFMLVLKGLVKIITALLIIVLLKSVCWALDYSTYTFVEGEGINRWAYENSAGDFTGITGGAEFDSTKYNFSEDSDDSRATVDSGVGNTNPVAQRFLFSIQESNISSITVHWEGYAEDNKGDKSASLYIWNFNTPGWELLGSAAASGVDEIVENVISSNISYYIQNSSCHIKAYTSASSGGGLASRWSRLNSDFIRVTIGYTNQLPNNPANLEQRKSPSDDTVVSFGSWTNVANPRFVFNLDDSDDYQLVKYNIQISTYSDFSSIHTDYTSPDVDTTLTPVTTWYQCPLLEENTYYWKVKCIDEITAESTYSSATVMNGRHITIDITDPTVPAMAAPLSNYTTNQFILDFDWLESTDTFSGIQGYELRLSTTPDYSGTVYSSVTADTHAIMPLNQSQWYWTVRSSDTAGNYSNWASTWTVNIDTSAPSAVTNLSALAGSLGGYIDVSWTAPGDDGISGILNGEYRIDYATYTKSWNYTDYEVSIPTTNVNPQDMQSRVITSLDEGATYYFRIWSVDDIDNWSSISNGATTWAQSIAPGKITDLAAVTGIEKGEVDIEWTAPGDDDTEGSATKYIVKYSSLAKINEAAWDAGDTHTFEQSWIPQSAGNNEQYTITGLIPDIKYYAAIKTEDERPNTSVISNSPSDFAQSDLVSPCAVSNLTVLTGTAEGEINLSWTAPGNDGTIWTAAFYLVKYATISINSEEDFMNASTYSQSWVPQTGGTSENRILTDLIPGVTYWIAIKGVDEKPNYGSLSEVNPSTSTWAGKICPAAITTLSALTGTFGGEIELSWSAPGDDGWTGTITTGTFRIDYSTESGTQWAVSSYKIEISTNDLQPSTVFNKTVTGLDEGATYYFRIWTSDEAGNWSGLSNGATNWAKRESPAAI
ncbi:hypothetical protein ACFLR5_00790, partial [Elusimicrobiota bacterium]